VARRVLDTNILIGHWHRHFRDRGRNPIRPVDAVKCAKKLIDLQGSDLILTPIAVEYICGSKNKAEAALADHYLAEFHVFDEGDIQKDDWINAKRYAAWVPRDGSQRQMGDSLIRAICDRLKVESLNTLDKRFPRRREFR
jgi:predicted nucleic acid-binding protein